MSSRGVRPCHATPHHATPRRKQIVTHSATFDFWPHVRHALRATPHGERPLSVEAYEKQTGKTARDRQLVIWEQQGLPLPQTDTTVSRGYTD